MTIASEQMLKNALDAQRKGDVRHATRLYHEVLKADPNCADAYGNLAIMAAQQGDVARAEQLFRLQIQLRPDAPAGCFNLGLVLQEQARFEEAIAALTRAIRLKPNYAEAHFAIGNAQRLQGKDEKAVASFRSAISVRSDYVEAYNNMALALQALGRSDAAISAYGKALALRPSYAEARFNLGVALHEIKALEQAEAAYRQAIAVRPEIPIAHNNLGAVLQDQGRFDEAMTAFHQAITLKPDFAEAHYNRATLLQQQARLDEALAAYRQAIKFRPHYVDAINNAGIVLQELGRADEAVALYRQILAATPPHAGALNNFATAQLATGSPSDAIATLQQALALKPDFPEACTNLGNAWRELGDLEQAIGAYQNALRLRPDDADAFSQLVYHRWRACDWGDYDICHDKLVEMVRQGARLPPFYLLATSASSADQLKCATQWAQSITPPPHEIFRHAAPVPGRIRLGYLSGDLQQHATAHLMAELFERHDRGRFEVIAYSYGRHDGSPMRARLDCAFDRFVDISSLSHRAAAERIHQDGIGILVELKGYTHQARPRIAAYRPAPVQVNYLGFPATMGAGFIDYLIADEIVVRPSEQAFFSEQVVRLPGCYQVNDRKRETATLAASRSDCGLPADGFVFCSFNNSYKITPVMFDIWMRLLSAVPGSVLWLLEANPLVSRNLRSEAEKRGVDPDRLVFAPIVASADHLARHRNADLFLDTLPCSAHTTASDALWAGLPVLTCAGNTFAGRVAASLLQAVGLPELITASLMDYERTALALARDAPRLTALRATLRKNRDTAPLFDLPVVTRNIEAAYLRMWERWCAGREPAAFSLEDRPGIDGDVRVSPM
jgi:protein O-GlcNAc transferase